VGGGPAGSEVVLQVSRDNDTMRVRIPSTTVRDAEGAALH